MVTHYAEPTGYVFGGSDVSGFGRSHASRGSRSAAAGKPACGPHCRSLPSFASGNLKAPAIAAPGASGARTSRRSPQGLSAQSGTAASCGFLARALSQLLEREPGQLESIRGSRTRKRNAGAQTQMRGTGPHRFRGGAKSSHSLRQYSTNSAIKAVDRASGRESRGKHREHIPHRFPKPVPDTRPEERK